MKAIHVLEGVKLRLSQKNFVFVLGLDRNTITSYVSMKYAKVPGVSGDQYLDKLFQVSFFIPDYSRQLDGYARKLIKRYIGEVSVKDFEPILPSIGTMCRDNPRAIKRFLNNVLIDREIAGMRSELADIPLVQFGLARALQMHWPYLANAIKQDDEDFCKKLVEIKSDPKPRLALEKLSKEESNNASIYQILLKDLQAYHVVFSDASIGWLTGRNRNSVWSFIKERSGDLYHDKSEFGELFDRTKRGRIINASGIYPEIVQHEEQRARLKALWPNEFANIVSRASCDFWQKINWNCAIGTSGSILGAIKHYETGIPMYLMEFDFRGVPVYAIVDQSCVELIELARE